MGMRFERAGKRMSFPTNGKNLGNRHSTGKIQVTEIQRIEVS